MKKAAGRELDTVFYCRSIAVVGASSQEGKAGFMFVSALLEAGFRGDIFPVNLYEQGKVLGLPIYPRLQDIPVEVDMVVVAVPRSAVLDVLEDCAAKGVKAAQFFTAGFRELDADEGSHLETAMLEAARRGGFRIIGPNCVGTCVPSAGKPLLGPTTLGTMPPPGNAAFASQSGGIAGELVVVAAARGIGFSKLISFGNGLDLDAAQLLDYFGSDPDTAVIGAYLEGAARGRELFQVVREVTRTKPIVVWKGGATTAGAETSASHTGSLAASATVWSTAMKQAGVVQVQGMEEMADTILAFQSLGPTPGNRVALITGLAAGGGGDSVTGADICQHHGLQVPQFTPQTHKRLDSLLGRLGSILRNPVDAAQRRESPELLAEVLTAVAADPNIDMVLVEEHMGIMVEFHPPERIQAINDVFTELKRQGGKPLAMILTPGLAEEARRDAERQFMGNGVPVFASINSAARALGHLTAYNRYRSSL